MFIFIFIMKRVLDNVEQTVSEHAHKKALKADFLQTTTPPVYSQNLSPHVSSTADYHELLDHSFVIPAMMRKPRWSDNRQCWYYPSESICSKDYGTYLPAMSTRLPGLIFDKYPNSVGPSNTYKHGTMTVGSSVGCCAWCEMPLNFHHSMYDRHKVLDHTTRIICCGDTCAELYLKCMAYQGRCYCCKALCYKPVDWTRVRPARLSPLPDRCQYFPDSFMKTPQDSVVAMAWEKVPLSLALFANYCWYDSSQVNICKDFHCQMFLHSQKERRYRNVMDNGDFSFLD